MLLLQADWASEPQQLPHSGPSHHRCLSCALPAAEVWLHFITYMHSDSALIKLSKENFLQLWTTADHGAQLARDAAAAGSYPS